MGMPVCLLLVCVRQAEQGRFIKMPAHQLHPHRQIVSIEANRKSQTGHARQVGREGEHIFKVHCQRIAPVPAGTWHFSRIFCMVVPAWLRL